MSKNKLQIVYLFCACSECVFVCATVTAKISTFSFMQWARSCLKSGYEKNQIDSK